MTGKHLNDIRASGRVLVIHTLPAFVLFLSLVLTASFIVLTLSISAGYSLGNSFLHPNPFIAYEAFWPGQSLESVAAYAQRNPQSFISCTASSTNGYPSIPGRLGEASLTSLGHSFSCAEFPRDNVFRLMNVYINNQRVQELNLSSTVLQQEALLLYWGAPDVIKRVDNNQVLLLYWDQGSYSARAVVQDQDSVVKQVTLTSKE